MNIAFFPGIDIRVSAGCHINDVMNCKIFCINGWIVSAGCHINDVMNKRVNFKEREEVSAGCHINDVMNSRTV